MNYYHELLSMRKRFNMFRMCGALPRPRWMKDDDKLSRIYAERKTLFKYGTVYYARIVQANTILFSTANMSDSVADIVFSYDARLEKEPEILDKYAKYIYHYKEASENLCPEDILPAIKAVRDEYCRDEAQFHGILDSEKDILFCMAPVIVFRKHLPLSVLKGGIIPILAAPEHCKSIMILPYKYWSRDFINDWKKR